MTEAMGSVPDGLDGSTSSEDGCEIFFAAIVCNVGNVESSEVWMFGLMGKRAGFASFQGLVENVLDHGRGREIDRQCHEST